MATRKTRRSFIKETLGSLAAVSTLPFNSCSQHKPKNILFIAINDLKPLLACYGDHSMHTPNIDKLAQCGTTFYNNHCQQAVCDPSRASLLTGLYSDENKTWEFTIFRDSCPDVFTLPQYFRQNGYTTVNISKIFDQRTVNDQGDRPSWTEAFPLTEADLNPYYDRKAGPVYAYFYQSQMVKERFAEIAHKTGLKGHALIREVHKNIKPATECLDLPDNACKEGVFADKAVMDLEKLAAGKAPFFLAVGFERPHLPFTAPKRYWDFYDPGEIETASYQQLAKNDCDYFYSKSKELQVYTSENGERIYNKLADDTRLTPDEQTHLIHGYKAAVCYIDAQVGKILDKLDELNLRDNTIIVLWGDHGWHLGDHAIWGKATNFEQATRSPLIICVPGQQPNNINSPTGFIDLFPTLCELAGLDIPDSCSGHDLVNLIEGKTRSAGKIKRCRNSCIPNHSRHPGQLFEATQTKNAESE
jgi:arylsulfatase A-like enzyme